MAETTLTTWRRPILESHLRQLTADVHAWAQEKGWWDDAETKNRGELIALIHSELSEALEALRHGNPPSQKCPGISHVEEELADVIIRIMDWAGFEGWDIGAAIAAKMEYNEKRPHRHGGKAF